MDEKINNILKHEYMYIFYTELHNEYNDDGTCDNFITDILESTVYSDTCIEIMNKISYKYPYLVYLYEKIKRETILKHNLPFRLSFGQFYSETTHVNNILHKLTILLRYEKIKKLLK